MNEGYPSTVECLICSDSGYIPREGKGNRLDDYSFCGCPAGVIAVGDFQQAILDVQEDLQPDSVVESMGYIPRDEANLKYQAALFLYDCVAQPYKSHVSMLEAKLIKSEQARMAISLELENRQCELRERQENIGPGNNGMGWDPNL